MIYPQYINGHFRKLKDYVSFFLVALYIFASWLRWNRGDGAPNQALMVDLPNRKAYIFSIEIWPDELYYITIILILAAMGLFFATSLYGRVWCGFTCPHTVFVDFFVKVERFFLGDRNQRIKFYELPLSKEKITSLLKVHILWIALGFLFAFGWVSYFYDTFDLMKDIALFQVSSSGVLWLAGLTFSTYFFAGFIREKVCIYMCPYGRFQSALMDNDSSIVTYNNIRGEPRGKLGSVTGDCIDCNKCVVVCPMGIDIRNGLQIACIGCGLCVDACDSVMEKINKPKNLIGFFSINQMNAFLEHHVYKKAFIRAKTLIFGGVFFIVSTILLIVLLNKAPVTFELIHEREKLFSRLEDGSIANSYTLRLQNKTHSEKKFIIKVVEDGFKMKLQGVSEYLDSQEITVAPEADLKLLVFIKQPQEKKNNESSILDVVLTEENDKLQLHTSIKFMSTK